MRMSRQLLSPEEGSQAGPWNSLRLNFFDVLETWRLSLSVLVLKYVRNAAIVVYSLRLLTKFAVTPLFNKFSSCKLRLLLFLLERSKKLFLACHLFLPISTKSAKRRELLHQNLAALDNNKLLTVDFSMWTPE